MKITRLAAAALFVLLPVSGLPWATRGHSVIDHTAIDAIPADGPVFLKKYADYIANSASIPDTWRDAGGAFSRIEEDPNHGWFREQFASVRPIPRSRYEWVIALYKEHERIAKTDPQAAKLMNVRWTGTLPYAAIEAYERIVDEMRRYRIQQKAGKPTADLEQTTAALTWQLGHYIGDGAEPLHDTIHHNGWLGPNPNGYATDGAIHSRFESTMVDNMKLSEADLMPLVGPPQHLSGDVFENILAFLDKSGDRTEAIYKMDKRGALKDPKDPEARQMVILCASDGARMLRDLVYRAWLESAAPNPNTDPALVSDKNPRYNPETGSAPAPKSPEVAVPANPAKP